MEITDFYCQVFDRDFVGLICGHGFISTKVYFSYRDYEIKISVLTNGFSYILVHQCPRTDLSKRFLPKPMTTTE